MTALSALNSIRIIPRDSEFLDRKLGSRGEIFFDQASSTLRLYDGITTGGIPLLRADLSNAEVGIGAVLGDNPPTGNTVQTGSIWFNTSNGRLYIYYNDGNSTQWVQPTTPSYGSGGGATTFAALTDNAGLTADRFYLPAITQLAVTANGSSAYRFDQYSTADNPTIYAISGTTIAFDLSVGLSSHPFLIRYAGANYSTGLVHVTTGGIVSTGAAAQGKTSGTLYWKIPAGISGTYGYLCSNHGVMAGVITIKDISAI